MREKQQERDELVTACATGRSRTRSRTGFRAVSSAQRYPFVVHVHGQAHDPGHGPEPPACVRVERERHGPAPVCRHRPLPGLDVRVGSKMSTVTCRSPVDRVIDKTVTVGAATALPWPRPRSLTWCVRWRSRSAANVFRRPPARAGSRSRAATRSDPSLASSSSGSVLVFTVGMIRSFLAVILSTSSVRERERVIVLNLRTLLLAARDRDPITGRNVKARNLSRFVFWQSCQ